MKSLVLCACVLILATSKATELKQSLKNAVKSTFEDDAEACLTEIDVTRDDIYREEEIMTNLHTEPENEERTRKNGCFIACLLKKQNLMEGTTIKEVKIHEMINNELRNSPGEGVAHRVARKCMKQVRGMTEECEKSFSLFVCVTRFVHKLQDHEEHVREETEEKTDTEENAETEE